MNYVFGIAEGLIPLAAGIYAMRKVNQWGFKSDIGRSLTFFNIALLGWGMGVLVEAYYNVFLKVEVPYPSLGDLGYVSSIVSIVIGTILLAKSTGASARIKTTQGKLYFVPVFVLILCFTYYSFYFLSQGSWVNLIHQGLVRVLLDIFYNFSDVVILSTGTLIFGLSARSLGGIFKVPVRIILFSLVMIYLADVLYSYQVNTATYFVGSIADLQYVFAFALLSFAVLQFDPNTLLGRSLKDRNL